MIFLHHRGTEDTEISVGGWQRVIACVSFRHVDKEEDGETRVTSILTASEPVAPGGATLSAPSVPLW